MVFWKFFAWIALGWAALFRRGSGIVLIRKTRRDGDAEAERQSGPGWRRVSTTRVPDPKGPPPSEE